MVDFPENIIIDEVKMYGTLNRQKAEKVLSGVVKNINDAVKNCEAYVHVNGEFAVHLLPRSYTGSVMPHRAEPIKLVELEEDGFKVSKAIKRYHDPTQELQSLYKGD